MQTAVESTLIPGNGATRHRVTGPSFTAVQNAVAKIMDRDDISASSFDLPRNVGTYFEAVGTTVPRVAA